MKQLEGVKRLVAWLGGREPVVLLAVMLLVGLTWGFIAITDEVLEGETQSFDEQVVRAMRSADDPSQPIGPPWLHDTFRDVTALGGISVLLFVSVLVTGFLWLNGQRRMAVFVVIAATSGMVLSLALKALFDRPRPSIVPHLSLVHTSSFPSGHAMVSAAVYLTLGALVARTVKGRRLKIYVLSMALALSLAVGVSRVYLGVHYPTDVLAGWMGGLVWALLCWMVARWWLRPGTDRGG